VKVLFTQFQFITKYFCKHLAILKRCLHEARFWCFTPVILVTWEAEVGGSWFGLRPAGETKLENPPSPKLIKAKWTGGVVQVVA
jgi:hypothetical protein